MEKNNKYNVYICHYYEKETGAFKNLSDLSYEEAELIQKKLREDKTVFASKRSIDYLDIRRQLESQARDIFISKGGKPKRLAPHYLTYGECDWFYDWYKETQVIKIPIDKIDINTISFTYGDLFPTMRYNDGKPYRKNIYTYTEILKIIEEFGLPQQWNKDGKLAPERYIEVQLWDDEILKEYI